ncbi:MAG: hypothetical protein KAS95_09380 [Candidatus Heimdallarchaeota archaeon]|nr:hypothetical protein [Candidatus Heimdallarchaeota archaeon]
MNPVSFNDRYLCPSFVLYPSMVVVNIFYISQLELGGIAGIKILLEKRKKKKSEKVSKENKIQES